jgi:hypothetical protein
MLPILSQSKWYGSNMKQRQTLKGYDILWANSQRAIAGATQKIKGPQLWI